MKKIIMMCLLVTTWLLSLRGMEIPIDQPSDSEFWPEEYLRLMEAVNQGDKATLAKFAKNSDDSAIRYSAIYYIHDQPLLEKIAKNDSDSKVRQAAVIKIQNHEFLSDIAKNDENEQVRLSAAKKTNNQVVITEIARSTKEDWIRAEAIKKLEDKDVIREFLKNEDIAVRLAVAMGLDDKILLEKFVKDIKNAVLRWHAVEKLDDQTFLAELAKNDIDSLVRQVATWKLTDKSLLSELAKNDKNEKVRDTATRKLTELNKMETKEQPLSPAVITNETKQSNPETQLPKITVNSTDDESLKNKTTTTSLKWFFMSMIGLLFFSFFAVFLLIRKLRILKGEKTKP